VSEQEKGLWWCCAAEFGHHESACPNYEPEPSEPHKQPAPPVSEAREGGSPLAQLDHHGTEWRLIPWDQHFTGDPTWQVRDTVHRDRWHDRYRADGNHVELARQLAAVTAERDALRSALLGVEELHFREGENANARFERIGEVFYRETGYLRPGKSESPHTWHPGKDEEREAAFTDWTKKRINAARAALAAPAAAGREEGE